MLSPNLISPESTLKKLVSSIGTFVACNCIVPEFPILSKDSLKFLNSVGLKVPPPLGRANPIESLIFPFPSIIWSFLKPVEYPGSETVVPSTINFSLLLVSSKFIVQSSISLLPAPPILIAAL